MRRSRGSSSTSGGFSHGTRPFLSGELGAYQLSVKTRKTSKAGAKAADSRPAAGALDRWVSYRVELEVNLERPRHLITESGLGYRFPE